MSKSSQYVGLDVSLKETSICVIDDVGKIVWRGRTESTPEAIASAVKQHAPHAVRIGLESGRLSSWLFHGLKVAGLPVICIDAVPAHAHDLRQAEGVVGVGLVNLQRQRRLGMAREVTVKGLDCQAVRALLVARAQIVSQITTTKNCVRGILKTFGRVLPKGLRSQFPGRVRAAIDGDPILGAIIFTRKQIIGCACSPKEHGPGPMYPHPPPRRIGANFRGRLRQFHGSTTALRILGREAFVGQRPGGAVTVRAAMAEREPAARSAGWSGHRSLRYCPHLGIVPHALNLGGSSALAFISFSLHGRHVGGVRFR